MATRDKKSREKEGKKGEKGKKPKHNNNGKKKVQYGNITASDVNKLRKNLRGLGNFGVKKGLVKPMEILI
ncbi:MAG: hypothetical protein CM15mP22_1810 [Gammaproteobacteria bacterium]|nr:MAG: hypothetical protein CM15mP22_1810 [Gammaproteobacteria bacterium]